MQPVGHFEKVSRNLDMEKLQLLELQELSHRLLLSASGGTWTRLPKLQPGGHGAAAFNPEADQLREELSQYKARTTATITVLRNEVGDLRKEQSSDARALSEELERSRHMIAQLRVEVDLLRKQRDSDFTERETLATQLRHAQIGLIRMEADRDRFRRRVEGDISSPSLSASASMSRLPEHRMNGHPPPASPIVSSSARIPPSLPSPNVGGLNRSFDGPIASSSPPPLRAKPPLKPKPVPGAKPRPSSLSGLPSEDVTRTAASDSPRATVGAATVRPPSVTSPPPAATSPPPVTTTPQRTAATSPPRLAASPPPPVARSPPPVATSPPPRVISPPPPAPDDAPSEAHAAEDASPSDDVPAAQPAAEEPPAEEAAAPAEEAAAPADADAEEAAAAAEEEAALPPAAAPQTVKKSGAKGGKKKKKKK